MGKTFGDIVAITNSGSADAESAQSSINVTPGATITEITVQDLTVGHTYAVKIDFPGVKAPQKYVVPAGGAPVTNGSALVPAFARINCRIPVPAGLSTIKVSTYADTASATVEVGIKWELGAGGQVTYSDFGTASVGTSETLLATISVPGGAHLKQVVVSSRLGVGLVKNVRLDYAGIESPQKYVTQPMLYDATGTQVQAGGILGSLPVDIDVTIPGNVGTVYLYATSQTAANTSAGGLVWI